MKRTALILTTLLLAGCAEGTKTSPNATGDKSMQTAAAAASKNEADMAPPKQNPEPKADSVDAGVTELTPLNTKIEFVGTHVGEKPDPRLGGFAKFTGKMSIDPETKFPTAISFEIATDSLWTQIGDKLTQHLKSPDFFDVKEFPEIKFQSTQVDVQDKDAGKLTVTGDLTLHGVTKPIGVPMTMSATDVGKKQVAEFSIDRTEFGMTYGEGKVENMVSLTVVIGEKTEPKTAAANPNP